MLLICPLTAGAGWDGFDKGPLKTRVQSPPYTMFLTPVPETPALVPPGNLSVSMALDYSSIFLYAQSSEWFTLIDMEMMVLNFSMEYRLTEKLSLTLNIPLADMNAGVMDSFLADFHTQFNLNDYGRSYRPENTFAYKIRVNNEDWINTQPDGLQLADGSVSAKYMFLNEETTNFLTAGCAYVLKVPMGDTSYGLGSGEFDHGFFLLARARSFPFIFYLNTGVILPGDPETAGPDVHVNDIRTLFIGTEYVMKNRKCSLLLQLNCFDSPFNDTGIEKLDKSTMELSMGLIWDVRANTGLEFAFCEDLSQTGTPDFTFHGRIFHRWEL